MDVWLWTENMKISASHIKINQNIFPMTEVLNKNINNIVWLVDVSQLHPLVRKHDNGHTNRLITLTKTDATHGPNSMESYIQKML